MLLEVDQVEKRFRRGRSTVHAVNGVTLQIGAGETVGLIGESGSGKSTIGRMILGLAEPDAGVVRFEGMDLHALSPDERRALTRRLTVVFQEPYESLNPRLRVGGIVGEPLRIHEPRLNVAERRQRVLGALELVGLEAAFADRFPRQLSGGQQQRVGIARAIVTEPRFVVLDEPTSALDVSVRSQVLEVLQRLQRELGPAFLFISHDLHTVRYVSDRVAVLYLGQIVEIGPTAAVLSAPQHPYTQVLMSSVLSPDPSVQLPRLEVTGEIPTPTALPEGCLFYSRCPFRSDTRCATQRPPLREVGDEHWVATFYAPDGGRREPAV